MNPTQLTTEGCIEILSTEARSDRSESSASAVRQTQSGKAQQGEGRESLQIEQGLGENSSEASAPYSTTEENQHDSCIRGSSTKDDSTSTTDVEPKKGKAQEVDPLEGQESLSAYNSQGSEPYSTVETSDDSSSAESLTADQSSTVTGAGTQKSQTGAGIYPEGEGRLINHSFESSAAYSTTETSEEDSSTGNSSTWNESSTPTDVQLQNRKTGRGKEEQPLEGRGSSTQNSSPLSSPSSSGSTDISPCSSAESEEEGSSAEDLSHADQTNGLLKDRTKVSKTGYSEGVEECSVGGHPRVNDGKHKTSSAKGYSPMYSATEAREEDSSMQASCGEALPSVRESFAAKGKKPIDEARGEVGEVSPYQLSDQYCSFTGSLTKNSDFADAISSRATSVSTNEELSPSNATGEATSGEVTNLELSSQRDAQGPSGDSSDTSGEVTSSGTQHGSAEEEDSSDDSTYPGSEGIDSSSYSSSPTSSSTETDGSHDLDSDATTLQFDSEVLDVSLRKRRKFRKKMGKRRGALSRARKRKRRLINKLKKVRSSKAREA